jgi:hypothetical protein
LPCSGRPPPNASASTGSTPASGSGSAATDSTSPASGNPGLLITEIDSKIVGFKAAEAYLGYVGHPSKMYVRAQTDQVSAVDSVLAATVYVNAPHTPE